MPMASKAKGPEPTPACVPMGLLPPGLIEEGVRVAREANPLNDVAGNLLGLFRRQVPTIQPAHLAMLVQKKWAPGTTIPVYFLDGGTAALRAKVLAHANAWHDRGANVAFRETGQRDQATVTLARTPGLGYWSMIGTDSLVVSRAGQQTLNLDGFTAKTREAEWRRVVRHEFGHALGFPHGQQTPEIVARIDEEKAIAYYMRTQGWSRDLAAAQFEALATSEVSLFGGNSDSVMTYPCPAFLLKQGAQLVPGGKDITNDDAAAARKFYPAAKVA
jgi:hypothetical protein